jgi:hypothetical protein
MTSTSVLWLAVWFLNGAYSLDHKGRAALLNAHRHHQTAFNRAAHVEQLLLSDETKYLAYQYNSGRLNNQLHSLAFAFRLCKEIGRVLILPDIRRTNTDWVGLSGGAYTSIATWDVEKLSQKFDFVTPADVMLHNNSKLGVFLS